jgi:hypothetical protein
MRIIKLGLFSFFFLFLLVTLMSLLIPSHVRLSRATNLPNDRSRLFSLLKNDTAWHPAYQDTASAKTMYSLAKRITEQTDSTLVMQLQQQDRKPVISGWQVYGKPSTDSMTLQWYMDFRLSWYPWEKFSSMFYERTYGVMMERGLFNLKKKMSPDGL